MYPSMRTSLQLNLAKENAYGWNAQAGEWRRSANGAGRRRGTVNVWHSHRRHGASRGMMKPAGGMAISGKDGQSWRRAETAA